MDVKVSVHKIHGGLDIKHMDNFYVVTLIDPQTNQVHAMRSVYTNDHGEGLWIDGTQVEGTSQFSVGKNPREAIRRYFQSGYKVYESW